MQVCAVLCYAQQNNVEPFLEPVLLLARTMMLHDTPAVASSSTGHLLEVFLAQLLTLADLCSHADPTVALSAAQCVAQLVSWFGGQCSSGGCCMDLLVCCAAAGVCHVSWKAAAQAEGLMVEACFHLVAAAVSLCVSARELDEP
jgi:hypothetical protein